MKPAPNTYWTVSIGCMPLPICWAAKIHNGREIERKKFHKNYKDALADIPKDEVTFNIQIDETPERTIQ